MEELTDLMGMAAGLSQAGQFDPGGAWDDILERARKAANRITTIGSESLRPEATASVCRAYIEHGMHTWPGNVKLYYVGPMFRRERPQKGRYRQFYQIGAEVLGQSDAPAIDAEVIEMLLAFFDRCGLVGYSTHVNSIGCKECRPKYVAKLKEALIEHINELKADSQRRVETNPLRVLDSKLPEEQAVIEKLPRITDHLCDACRAHYAEVKKQLDLRGVAYQENWRLVRGLDYYMRTTFEITAPGLGSQNAVCGGGRYDGLVELLGGQPTKGIGFAIGTDRLILSLQETKDAGKMPAVQGLDVFIAWMGAASQPAAVKIARKLREAGFSVEVPAEEMKFKKSIGLADKLGARFALIIGENELKEGKYALKRLSDGVQEKVGANELVEKVKQI
ncbi:MAG: histidine--tRNA ligase [Acidobacteria bacterium]|nr:histidine--tRNA ligase [Acidobacteriota bacterium]